MTAWFRMIICFAMAVMLILLIVSEQLSLLLHPRFHNWTYFSVLIFIILGWVQAINLKTKDVHPIGVFGYLFILLPIVAYIFVPPKALDASIVDKKGSILTKANKQQTDQSKTKKTKTTKINTDDPNYKNFQAMNKEQESIKFTDKNFANYLTALELYAEKLQGKRIRIKGFVYREPSSLKKNQFVIGRFTVACCTADANVLGIIAQFDDSRKLKTNQWYEVSGTLSTIKVFDYPSPMLIIDDYKSAEKPKDPYVYFSY